MIKNIEFCFLRYQICFEKATPWSIMDTMAAVQMFALQKDPSDNVRPLCDMDQLLDEHPNFVVATTLHFTETMYDKRLLKSALFFDVHASYLGNSSLVLDAHMKHEDQSLCVFRNQLLFLDSVANKKMYRIPDWLREIFDGGAAISGGPIKFAPLKKPEKASHVTRAIIGEVPHSDTNSRTHLHFSNYVKYCLCGFVEAQAGNGPFAHKSLPVKSVATWYKKECKVGDSLNIEYWMDDDKVYFDMTRDNASVFQCIVEIY